MSGVKGKLIIRHRCCAYRFFHSFWDFKNASECLMLTFHFRLRYADLEVRFVGLSTVALLKYIFNDLGDTLSLVLQKVLQMASYRSRLTAALAFLRKNKYRKIYSELSNCFVYLRCINIVVFDSFWINRAWVGPGVHFGWIFLEIR